MVMGTSVGLGQPAIGRRPAYYFIKAASGSWLSAVCETETRYTELDLSSFTNGRFQYVGYKKLLGYQKEHVAWAKDSAYAQLSYFEGQVAVFL